MKDQVISQHMVHFPICGTPEMSLTDGATIMKHNNIRHLPILADDNLVGIISDRDLKPAMALEQSPLLSLGDVMKKDVYVVTQDTYLSEVALQMAEGKLGSAVIVDSHNRVLGIFTTTDALYLLASELEGETLEDYFLERDGDLLSEHFSEDFSDDPPN